MLVSAILGSMFSGPLVDNLGRRISMLINTIPYIIGPLIMGFSTSYWMLVGGRFIAGLGVGIATTLVPMYVAEISPPAKRGSFVMVILTL